MYENMTLKQMLENPAIADIAPDAISKWDPDSYITCGFSAGGYIVCLWNTEKGYRSFGLPKPKACFPIYPVTSYRILDAEEWLVRDHAGQGVQSHCDQKAEGHVGLYRDCLLRGRRQRYPHV